MNREVIEITIKAAEKMEQEAKTRAIMWIEKADRMQKTKQVLEKMLENYRTQDENGDNRLSN